jgi:hypothetical protein
MPCALVSRYQHLGGTYYLHLQPWKGNMSLRNVRICQNLHTALQSRRLTPEFWILLQYLGHYTRACDGLYSRVTKMDACFCINVFNDYVCMWRSVTTVGRMGVPCQQCGTLCEFHTHLQIRLHGTQYRVRLCTAVVTHSLAWRPYPVTNSPVSGSQTSR